MIVTAIGLGTWGIGFVFFAGYGLLVRGLLGGRATVAGTLAQAAAWPVLSLINLARH